MLQLPLNERLVLYAVLAVYLIAGAVAVRQLSTQGRRYHRILISLIALGVCLQSLLLIFRAVELQAFPLTGLFESMVFLGITFGLGYLFLSIIMPHVWFASTMTWIMLLIAVLGAKVAEPASEVHHAARTPWAIAHGLAMILSAAAIAFSAASAWMYLLASKRLKNKELGKVLGRMPNIEKLGRMNVCGIEAGFILLGFGLFTGFGMAAIQIRAGQTTLAHWLIDPKIVLITVAWLLLAAILILRPLVRLRDKTVAWLTVLTFFLIIFATVGVTIFCGTRHVFSQTAVIPARRDSSFDTAMAATGGSHWAAKTCIPCQSHLRVNRTPARQLTQVAGLACLHQPLGLRRPAIILRTVRPDGRLTAWTLPQWLPPIRYSRWAD